jgi:hypothetical protein
MLAVTTRDAMILEGATGWAVRWYDYTEGKYPYYRGEKGFKTLEQARSWRDKFLEVGVRLVWHPNEFTV